MRLAELDRPEPAAVAPVRHERAVCRTPFYFNSRGEPLFAWLHTTGDHRDLTHAAVIAAPLGYEQIHAHRSLRHLADQLARQGIPALRFDWHGTGDSAGSDEDADRVCTWQTNLRDAVDLLQRQFGFEHVSVMGLRLGATLAAATLTENEIANLVLWAPVVNGRTYVREMIAVDRMSEIAQPQTPGAPADLEPAGLTLCEQTAQDISKINLLHRQLPRCRTLIVSRDDVLVDQKLSAAYAAARIPAEQISAPGYAGIFASPHRGEVPRQAIHDIAKWMRRSCAMATIPQNVRPSTICAVQQMTTFYQPEGPARQSAKIRLRERTLEISAQPHLFGIVSEPIATPAAERPTIILLNAGATYRAGPGRLHVHLARRLAAKGFRCLRLDTHGLGDSVTDNAHCENNSYSSTVFRDIDLTMRFLQQQQMGRRFVLIGLCSGAYAAFQAAVSSADASLVESILLNPLTFYWRDGMTIDDSIDRQLIAQHYYLGSALRPGKWLKFLTGRTKIGWSGGVRMLAGKLRMMLPQSVIDSSTQRPARPADSHPQQDDLPGDLRQISAHQRHLAMFFADTDPGYAILTGKARKPVNSLRKSGRLDITFLTYADHNFSRRSARRDLIDALTLHLQRRYPTN